MNDGLPRLERDPVRLPPLAGAADDLWTLLIDLALTADIPWTLVGGQMVMLHGLEHGRPSPRVSTDIDTVVDVRAAPSGIRRLVEVLTRLGLEPAAEPGPQGLMHRYVRPGTNVGVGLAVPATSVDVLVPEGLGPAADTRTSNGGRAFPAAGTSQALARSENLPVVYGDRHAWVPRPDLLGAIVGKAVGAVVDDRDPVRHLRDLVFLCSLVADPFGLHDLLTPKDRRRLRLAATTLEGKEALWAALGEKSDDAQATWRILTDR